MVFNFIAKKIGFWRDRQARRHLEQKEDAPDTREQANPKLSESLKSNLDYLQNLTGNGGDVKIHGFSFGKQEEYQGALIFIDGLVNMDSITQGILKPLLSHPYSEREIGKKPDRMMTEIRQAVLCSGDVSETATLADAVAGFLSGDTVLLCDGCEKGLIISTKGWDKRSVTEPETESVVRGPREGFTENFRTNTALLRRKIKSPDLRMDQMTVGRKTQTSICITYLKGVARREVVDTVKARISSLDIDSVLDSGYLEEYISDAPFSVFPTIGFSEKPDVVAARILEGRVAILVDGSPFVLTAPLLFIESFQTAEDYYVQTIYASITRLMRFISFLIAIYVPGLYIALTTYHQEMLPTTLLMTIASAREGTPFPAFLEAFIMLFSFEVLREAGLRLPRPVGQAISIVGALVMGDAAVSAGLVGAPMVITIAISAVAGFVVPKQNDSISIIRLIIMVLASALGGYGIAMGFLAVLIHLASIKSFGVPYFEGLTFSRDQQDTFIRMPLWAMVKRPKDIASRDMTRRHFFVPPPSAGQGGQSNGEAAK